MRKLLQRGRNSKDARSSRGSELQGLGLGSEGPVEGRLEVARDSRMGTGFPPPRTYRYEKTEAPISSKAVVSSRQVKDSLVGAGARLP